MACVVSSVRVALLGTAYRTGMASRQDGERHG